jgi:hypothetical protein
VVVADLSESFRWTGAHCRPGPLKAYVTLVRLRQIYLSFQGDQFLTRYVLGSVKKLWIAGFLRQS